MRRVQHHAGASLALALDVDAWGATHLPTGGALGWLLSQGWRAVALTPDDRIDRVWQQLGAVRGGRAVTRAHP
jgi:hypothetical protein